MYAQILVMAIWYVIGVIVLCCVVIYTSEMMHDYQGVGSEGSDTLSNHVHFGSNQFSKHKSVLKTQNQFSKHEISSQNTKPVLKTRNQFSKYKIRFSIINA